MFFPFLFPRVRRIPAEGASHGRGHRSPIAPYITPQETPAALGLVFLADQPPELLRVQGGAHLALHLQKHSVHLRIGLIITL